ncbi:MAG: hypothetical protein H6622_09220 [Halobacteriovoraceae bacterium]|nr:hypothetical protein [Halobacteriovoraceae bacterium]
MNLLLFVFLTLISTNVRAKELVIVAKNSAHVGKVFRVEVFLNDGVQMTEVTKYVKFFSPFEQVGTGAFLITPKWSGHSGEFMIKVKLREGEQLYAKRQFFKGYGKVNKLEFIPPRIVYKGEHKKLKLYALINDEKYDVTKYAQWDSRCGTISEEGEYSPYLNTCQDTIEYSFGDIREFHQVSVL